MSVSIIMPMFNSGPFIEGAIRSVSEQTYEDWELLIVDDCSDDDSVNVVNRIVADEHRIKVISLSSNGGAAVARNEGIKASSGRYIAFLDSDDRWDPSKLTKQIEFMEERDLAFSHTGFRRVDSSTGAISSEYIPPERLTYKNMLYSNQVGCLTAMFDTKQVGRIEMPCIRKRQDYAMWLRILRKVGSVYGLNEVLASYTVRNDSISSNKISLLKYNYSVFRDCEGFSWPVSLYYLLANTLTRIKRGLS